jgi:hypothetical protein
MCPGGDHREIEPDANSVTKHNRVASGFEIAPSPEHILTGRMPEWKLLILNKGFDYG